MKQGRNSCILLLVALQLFTPLAIAHETDQYTLPLGRQFADLRDYFSSRIHKALVTAVESVNQEIRRASHLSPDSAALEQLQSGPYIAERVWEHVFDTFSTVEGIDAGVRESTLVAVYPGRLTAYKPERGIYDKLPLAIDLTKLVRTFFRASTIQINGTLTGSDKLIHFIYLGRPYLERYVEARNSGLDIAASELAASELSSGHNLFLSEDALLGSLTTGIRSNADLAANYAGLKFLRNIYESVRLGSRTSPPMLVRDGPFWRLNDHVLPYGDFFTRFVSPHWNEALNPNAYAWYARRVIRDSVLEHCPDLVDWYRHPSGLQRNQHSFQILEQQLASYYGEPYGWNGNGADTISLTRLCFTAPLKTANAHRDRSWKNDSSLLVKATVERRHENVSTLLVDGHDPDLVDNDGETALHAAVRQGDLSMAEILLEHHANPNKPGLYGTTPLLISAINQRYDMMQLLLQSGADPNICDIFGQTPLHAVAGRQAPILVKLLLAHGAESDAKNVDGRTPKQMAKRVNDRITVELLQQREETQE